VAISNSHSTGALNARGIVRTWSRRTSTNLFAAAYPSRLALRHRYGNFRFRTVDPPKRFDSRRAA